MNCPTFPSVRVHALLQDNPKTAGVALAPNLVPAPAQGPVRDLLRVGDATHHGEEALGEEVDREAAITTVHALGPGRLCVVAWGREDVLPAILVEVTEGRDALGREVTLFVQVAHVLAPTRGRVPAPVPGLRPILPIRVTVVVKVAPVQSAGEEEVLVEMTSEIAGPGPGRQKIRFANYIILCTV